jgi:nucleoid-associated protein YgaU
MIAKNRIFTAFGVLAFLAAASQPAFAAPARKHWVTHKVLAGESLRSIAKQFYGDASWWLHIYHTNVGTLKSPNASVRPGMVLKIEVEGPASKVAAQAPATTPPGYTQIQVKDGDTLESLAQAHMGSARFWPRILELNRSKIGPTHELTPGTYLKVQELAGAPAPAPRRTRAHRETYAAVDAADENSPINQADERPVAVGAPVPVAGAGRSPASVGASAAERPARSATPELTHYDDFIEP